MNQAPSIRPPPQRCAVIYCGSSPCPPNKIIKITNVTIYVPGILRSITPIKRRKIAPIIIAITDVSPIVPAVFPISISNVFTLSPAFNCASGVAPDTPSYTNVVILPVNEISRKHLAPSAGFIKFCPNPPNSCFTTKIANTLPSTHIHQGAVGGKFSASRRPVTTALKSWIVTFLCINF